MMTDLIAQMNADMLARKEASAFVSQSAVRSRTNKEIMDEAKRQYEDERYVITNDKVRVNKTVRTSSVENHLTEFEEIAITLNMSTKEIRKIYLKAMYKIRKIIKDNKERGKTLHEYLVDSEQIVIDGYFFSKPE